MNTIKNITEAYSSQPRIVRVGQKYDIFDTKSPIVESIELFINTTNGDKYRGFDKEGNVIFEWVAKSCNVEYKIDKNG